jgi:hypothetical protein
MRCCALLKPHEPQETDNLGSRFPSIPTLHDALMRLSLAACTGGADTNPKPWYPRDAHCAQPRLDRHKRDTSEARGAGPRCCGGQVRSLTTSSSSRWCVCVVSETLGHGSFVRRARHSGLRGHGGPAESTAGSDVPHGPILPDGRHNTRVDDKPRCARRHTARVSSLRSTRIDLSILAGDLLAGHCRV